MLRAQDEDEAPAISPWEKPTREQVRFALDLCRSEVPAAEYAQTRDSLTTLTRAQMSTLIASLTERRARRLHRRMAPRGRRR